LTLAGALAIMSVLGHYFAKPVLAQVRAALISNIDEPGRIPYTAALSSTSTTSTGGVYFPAPAVPANRRLVITSVSGILATQDTSSTGILEFFANLQDVRGMVPVGTTNIFSQTTQIYFNAGEAPAVFTNKPPQSAGSEVILSGYLLDCTAAACFALAP
jgi:hypothetical protein